MTFRSGWVRWDFVGHIFLKPACKVEQIEVAWVANTEDSLKLESEGPVPSVQPLLVSGTVYHYPFEQRHLSTPSDDTWRLICSPPPLPLTNKPYRPRLRFESCLTYGALQVLFTYLLTCMHLNCAVYFEKSVVCVCIYTIHRYTDMCINIIHRDGQYIFAAVTF